MISKEEIIEICQAKKTIPIEKLLFDASNHIVPTSKTTEWIATYFERTKWESLDPVKFKLDFIEYIKSIYKYEYILDFTCNNSSCDIFLPDLKVGFKLLGLFEYSEINVNKNNQSNTWLDFEAAGYHIIQIFEDSWNFKKEIVKNRIINILGMSSKIFARKCSIREISDNKLIRNFIESSHIQGNVGSSVKIGLYYNDELVSIMTFGKLRKNLGQKGSDGSYELLRFCNKFGTNVVGGASKLFKYFLDKYKPTCVISYADKCWSSEKCLYPTIGMSKVHDSDPSYFYIIGSKRKGRFGFRKDIVLQVGFDGNYVGEHTGMLHMGIYRMFDCGTMKFIYESKQ